VFSRTLTRGALAPSSTVRENTIRKGSPRRVAAAERSEADSLCISIPGDDIEVEKLDSLIWGQSVSLR
jgi:hypothetical protein